ncbi:MAG: histidinol dehydrogenase [Pseudarcicella sp.]|nr:histidinol dehydrogenase [Pseudarcicella sp.]MBP6411037.1 histidinol dehydrogenase [Pseudarcicella sp.]
MQIVKFPLKENYSALLKRPVQDISEIENKVKPILEKVKLKGDEAIREFALTFDNKVVSQLQVADETIQNATNQLTEELKKAIQQAYKNIYYFHQHQQSEVQVIETMPGVKCWRKSVGIEKVGLYIPGGTAPLFSTVLMLGIPAQIAGCKDVILCTPSEHPAIYYAAQLCGISKIYNIGGAQAIAAMAYGTSTVPQVYKIFGPGNQYVTAAKMLVNKEGIAIDMPAGPSEVAVFADDTAIPAFVASDLLSQAEHGIDSQVLLVSTSQQMILSVELELAKQLKELTRGEMASKALLNSKAILVENQEQAIDILNQYAAEHLILAVENSHEVAEQIINAGSIFLGNYTPESAGDYASGTNHTLPTNGFARAYSGVSLDSFVKKITMQEISQTGLQNLGNTIIEMANAESLDAHANAVKVRLNKI